MVDTDEVIKIVKSFVRKNARFVDFYGSLEDFEQEMLCHVYSKINKFDKTKGKLSSWVYKICFNKAMCIYKSVKNKIRLNKCRVFSEIVCEEDGTSLGDVINDEDYDFEENFYNKIQIHKLLPYMCVELKLKYFKNMNTRTIGKLFNKSHQTISNKINKNLKQLKEMIKSE